MISQVFSEDLNIRCWAIYLRVGCGSAAQVDGLGDASLRTGQLERMPDLVLVSCGAESSPVCTRSRIRDPEECLKTGDVGSLGV